MIKHKMSIPRRQTRPMRNDSLADLMASAKSGDPEVILHKASELGTDLNLVYPGGRTLLTKAIEDNEAMPTVEAIIKAGANVDVQNMQGKTALMVAIRVRRPDVLKVLLESGANQDLVTHKNSSVISQCLKEDLFSYMEILFKNVTCAVSICEKINEIVLIIRQRDKNFTTKSRSPFRFPDLTLKHGVIQAIKNGCSVNCTDETGTTPLMHAVKCHYDDCARLLLLTRADVNRINKKKETALTLAMTGGANPILRDLIMAGAFIKHPRSKTSSMHFEMFKKIICYLQQNRLFNMKDIHGKTALMYAAERGDRNCIIYAIEADIDEFVKIESLLERSNNSVKSVNICDDAGHFSSCCRYKESEGCSCEDCDKYAMEQMRKYKDKNGRPLLMYAFETGRRLPDSYIQLRACDDAGYRDEYGRTILMNFFKFYQQNTGVYITQALFSKAPPDLLEKLSSLKHAFEISYKSIKKLFGGQVNIRDNEGNSTVIYAIKYYDFITEEIVELLVGDTQKEQYEDGKTALMIALKDYKDHAVKYMKPLIGDSCNIQDKERKIALMYAITKPRGIPEPLIEQMIGDSQNVQDKDGKTALIYAITKPRGIPEPLIEQMIGDSQNVQDKDGKTALMYVMKSKIVFSDNLIIQMIGGCQNVQDNDGKTALMYAFIHSKQISEDMIELLAGENPFIQDKSGKTALMYALQFNQYLTYKNITYLFGGKVNIRDTEGNTTVIYAVKYYQCLTEEIIALLIGDTHAEQYEEGQTALMIALQFFNAHLENFKHCFFRDAYYFRHTPLLNAIRKLADHLSKEVTELHNANYLTGKYLKPLIGDTCNIQDKDGKTALMYVLINTRGLLDNLIKQMICDSQNIQDKDGKTALMYAMINTREIPDNLIKQMVGDSQKLQDKDGKTALMYAMINTRDIPDNLIKQMAGGSQNIQDKDGKTALMYVFIHNVQLSEEMIEHLAGGNPLIQDTYGKTALMYAFQFKRLMEYKTINALFRGKTNIRDNEGNTTVIYAIQYCTYINEEIINLLVGDTQKTQYKDGKTALMIALKKDTLSNSKFYFMQPLIGNSCNVQDNKGKTALMYAIKYDRNLPDLLMKQTSESLYVQENEGKTALMYAMKYKRDLPDHLIKQMIGESLSVQDNEGKTALMYAMKYKHNLPDQVIKMMITESQYIRDKQGKTALMHASQSFNFSNILIIKLFNRDLLNVQDIFGKTALHYAIEHDQSDSYLKHLILHGANLEVEDNNERTALILCLEIDNRNNAPLYGGRYYFLKTKMLLQYNPILRLNLKGKIFLINSIEKGIFSLMNLYKNKEIFRLMIANGVVPFPNQSKFSTLFVVLKHNILDVAKYVIANVCLTNDDLKMLNKAKSFFKSDCNARNLPSDFDLNGLDLSSRDLQHLVIGATSHPWPLVKLSFIAVNSAIGHDVNREHRIQMLPLPNPIKDMLMFNTRTALLPVSEWANIPMVFDPVEYEKAIKPRPLLNYWPFGEVLVV